MLSDPICLRVKGPFACFTMPEFHVERVSYPVITPSAARGILEAILMKPVEKAGAANRHNKVGFRWQILRLGIIRKGFFVPLLRNELGYESHPAYGNARGFDITEKRAQRHSLILKNVDYLIEACLEIEDDLGPGGVRHLQPRWKAVHVLAKYHQMFLRRARAGQCFYQPFFGCREFSVGAWDLIEERNGLDADGKCIWRLPNMEQAEMAKMNDHFGFTFRDFDFGKFWNDFDGRVFDVETGMPKLSAAQSLCAKANSGWIVVNRIENGKVVTV
nr:CRISPR-associated protein Cas5 [uncultured Methanoregula sp.]